MLRCGPHLRPWAKAERACLQQRHVVEHIRQHHVCRYVIHGLLQLLIVGRWGLPQWRLAPKPLREDTAACRTAGAAGGGGGHAHISCGSFIAWWGPAHVLRSLQGCVHCGFWLTSTGDCCGSVLLFRAVAKLQETKQLQKQRGSTREAGDPPLGWCAHRPLPKRKELTCTA